MNAAGADVVAALVAQGVLANECSGPSLGDLRRVRVPLTDGEAATVVIPLAEALDALHDAGLAYGPPRATDVTFEPDGRPVLVVPPAWAESPADDIPGLLRMVLGVMSPLLVDDEADDEPDLRPVLVRLLADGCRVGAEVARACFDAVEAEPVRMPDVGALARACLLGPVTRPAGPPAQLPRGTGAPRRRELRRRARRRTRLRVGGVVFVALAVIAAVLLHPTAGLAEAGPVRSPAALEVDPVLDRQAPAAAAAALTRQRAVIIGAGDAAGLDAVNAAGGPALDADEDLLASVGDDHLVGLSVDVQATTLVGTSEDEATVEVTSAMSPYTRVGEQGTQAVPGLPPRTVVLDLVWIDAGWRVWEVRGA
jgi:hypothetical protein